MRDKYLKRISIRMLFPCSNNLVRTRSLINNSSNNNNSITSSSSNNHNHNSNTEILLRLRIRIIKRNTLSTSNIRLKQTRKATRNSNKVQDLSKAQMHHLLFNSSKLFNNNNSNN